MGASFHPPSWSAIRPYAWRAALAALLVVIAVGFTTVQLQTSSRIGRLSNITSYDDVVYLNHASRIYFRFRAEGAGPAATEFLTQNPHAFFPVANALTGFLLLGPEVPRIYHMLAVVVLTFLAAVVYFTRDLPWRLRWALILGSLALPFATASAVEFRPDFMWATVLGASSVAWLAAERPFSRRRYALFYGVAVGALLLIKPSTFAMTLLVAGGAWILGAAAALAGRRATPTQIVAHLGWALLAAVAVAGWYWLLHGPEILGYFYVNSFGENRDVWKFRAEPWEVWTFYLRGSALHTNLGAFLLPFVLAYVAGALIDLRHGDWFRRVRGGAFLWMLLGAFVASSAFGMKSPFLGGAFYGLLLFGAIWQIVRLVRWSVAEGGWAPSRRQTLAAGAILSLALSGYAYPAVSQLKPEVRRAQKVINQGVLRDLLARTKYREGTSILLTHGAPVVWEYLQMEFRARSRDLRTSSAAFMKDPGEVLARAETFEYLVVQDPDLLRTVRHAIPGQQLQAPLLAHLRAAPRWQLVGRYPDGKGRFAYLYRNSAPRP